MYHVEAALDENFELTGKEKRRFMVHDIITCLRLSSSYNRCCVGKRIATPN